MSSIIKQNSLRNLLFKSSASNYIYLRKTQSELRVIPLTLQKWIRSSTTHAEISRTQSQIDRTWIPIITGQRSVFVDDFEQQEYIYNTFWKSLGTIAILTSLTMITSDRPTFNENLSAINPQELDLVELGSVNQFEEGSLYSIKVLGGKDSLLLVKINGEFHCCGNSCSHYGAPLHKGALGPGVVTCGLHGAQFDLKTGNSLCGPTTDGIPKFETKIQEDKIYALIPKVLPLSKTLNFVKKDPNDKRVYVIVGSGPAGLSAAETLRSEGYTGEIVMITKDSHLPYERPVLSKNMKAYIENIIIRSQEFVTNEIQMTFKHNCQVEQIDTKAHKMFLSDKTTINYDKAVVATGGTPVTLQVPGSNLENIFCLRDLNDNISIQPFAKQGARVVVIGSSFIGMEVASALTKLGVKVTVVGKSTCPFEKTLGTRIGNVLKKLFIENGVEFFMNTEVKSFKGNQGKVNGVELVNGEIIQADAVIYGLGISLNTNIIPGASKSSDGSIETNAFLQNENYSDIFFAGDIAQYPYYKTGNNIRVEHWNNAMQHGKVAAKNMLGKFIPYTEIPFFWTMMFGKSLRFTGINNDYDDVVFEGDVEKMKFVAYYAKNKAIVGVATMGMDPFSVTAQHALKNNLMPALSEIQLGLANSGSITEKVKEFLLQVNIKKIE